MFLYYLRKEDHQIFTIRNQVNTLHHYKISNHSYNYHNQFVFMVFVIYNTGTQIDLLSFVYRLRRNGNSYNRTTSNWKNFIQIDVS